MKEIEWTEAALADVAALDKGIARRVKRAVERFAATGAGNVVSSVNLASSVCGRQMLL